MTSRTTRQAKPLTRVYVGIGSNIHPRREIRSGLDRLARAFGPLDISPAYRCPAIGFSGRSFINLVIGFSTALPPEKIIAALRIIENTGALPVRRAKKFSSRRLDLDILLYGDHCGGAGLNIPRDDITDYAYTLWPLADIAGHSLHPELEITYRALRSRFSASQRVRRIVFCWRQQSFPIRSKR